MTKPIIQDILVEKKGIRAITRNDIVSRKSSRQKPTETNSFSPSSLPPHRHVPFEYGPHSGEHKPISHRSRILLWILSFASIGGLLFSLSLFFATATVTVTPKNVLAQLSDTYSIVAEEDNTHLPYHMMHISKTLSVDVPTDGEEYVERKAIGKAMIYNNYGTAVQRLVNNTRLETASGKIYRIRESVDVPGVKTVNGERVPGSVEVEIIADIAGDAHNLKVSDAKENMTIPGFAGTPRFSGFYARLSVDAIGGYIGNVKKVSEDTLVSEKQKLADTLKTELIKEIFTQKPEEYQLFPDAYFIEYKELPAEESGAVYKITSEATIHAVVFSKTELSSFIARAKVPSFDGSATDALWNDQVSVTIAGKTNKPWEEKTLSLTMSGQVLIAWAVDRDTLTKSLLGQPKSMIRDILEKNKNSLVGIEASIRPQWKGTFPSKAKKIKIIDTIRDSRSS